MEDRSGRAGRVTYKKNAMDDFFFPFTTLPKTERDRAERPRTGPRDRLVLEGGDRVVLVLVCFFAAKTPSCRALGMGNVKRVSRPTPWRARSQGFLEGGREYFPASSSSGISSPVTSPSAVFGRVAGAMLPYLYRVPRCQVPAGILVDEQRSLIGWWHRERVRDPHSEVGWLAWRYYGQITSSIALTAANTPNH
ncbi:hypothetical protein ASPFODRAFT_55504 [Aspergillus luchuensis CBS 106.47]|uniref:Uncharacterized protein n=1 Tax=Aspergillus luchuensis (strain CBS 106.47) TaxID=1137211 RepID=A0A1M3TYF7_ASPLC|nr:hypothetical protein ASPFODRAFT_55504 [Aspergillus luchuensis CBS 106.47]